MLVYVLVALVAVAVYICSGIVCGRICTEIVRDKNPAMNEVLWFWAGFLFTVVAVFMTLCVVKRK